MHDAVERLGRRLPLKRAFITGAASGVALEISRRLAAGGWNLGMLDVNAAELAAARQSLNSTDSSILTYHADVRDGAGVTQAVNRFAQSVGGLDLMINNAGVAVAGSVLETSTEDWRWALEINLLGCVHGCRAAIPHLLASNSAILLNIASAAGFASGPGMSAYNASKAGVISLTETLQQELAGSGVRLTVAMPSFFKTNLLATARAPESEMQTARVLMDNSRYSLQQAAEDILGAAADDRFYAVLPRRYVNLWRLKRFFPMRFMRAFPRLWEKLAARMRRRQAGDSSD